MLDASAVRPTLASLALTSLERSAPARTGPGYELYLFDFAMMLDYFEMVPDPRGKARAEEARKQRPGAEQSKPGAREAAA